MKLVSSLIVLSATFSANFVLANSEPIKKTATTVICVGSDRQGDKLTEYQLVADPATHRIVINEAVSFDKDTETRLDDEWVATRNGWQSSVDVNLRPSAVSVRNGIMTFKIADRHLIVNKAEKLGRYTIENESPISMRCR